MSFRSNQLPMPEQLKLRLLNEEDRVAVLKCRTVDEAIALLKSKEESVRLPVGSYEPKLQVSGSAVKYKTKNLFTENFDEQDVKDFMNLAELSLTTPDEVVVGELQRIIKAVAIKGKQPLQCMVYATKQKEKVFFNNDKKVSVWAEEIAQYINTNPENITSINHMLVNWGMWKFQIVLLITACGFIKQNEKLDEVIRDLYTDYDDDKVRYAVMKRLFQGLNTDNYQSAFAMLKKVNFIKDRKYFNILKKRIQEATEKEFKALYAAFRGTQGFNAREYRKIENLFNEQEESEIVKLVNQSNPDQKDVILKDIKNRIFGQQRECRFVALQAKNFKLYRSEIQQLFMKKLNSRFVSDEEVKICGLAIGDLDTDEKEAISFFDEQLKKCNDDSKKVMYSYVKAVLSDDFVDNFILCMMKYDGGSIDFLKSVGNLKRPNKNPLIRRSLYDNCLRIKEKNGFDSSEFKTAIRNIGVYLQGGITSLIYDVRLDQMLFDFIGYDAVNRVIDGDKCTERNVKLVLEILENDVMNKSNYEGRYQNFMWDLFKFFKDLNDIDITDRIENSVKRLSHTALPTT